MKSLIKRYPVFSKRIVMAAIFAAFIISCSKNTDSPTDLNNNYCGTIVWKNTIGLSGSFEGNMSDGQYNLVAVYITDDGVETHHVFNRTNENHVILNDKAGWTFTYEDQKIVKLVMGNATELVTYTFDTHSHLTKAEIQVTDEDGSRQIIFNYIYDANDDPVKITGHGVEITSTGTSTSDYDITADYLTDKLNFLPLAPEITPFSIYYAYTYYLSRHLINKWVIKITGTDEQEKPILPTNFTQQYTYTYDADSNVATMVHTGNSNNKFTFTFSDCH